MDFRFRIISLILGIILICGCITPEEKTDLIKNGGFESVLNGQPSFWETVTIDGQNWVFSVDNVVKHSGDTSVSIEGNGNWAYWMQHFEGEAVPTGREVTVSGYIKTEGVDQRAEIEIWCVDSDGDPTEAVTAPISGTKDWTFVTASQRIPEDAVRMDINLFIWGPGNVWFDDVQLLVGEEVKSTAVTTSPEKTLSGYEEVSHQEVELSVIEKDGIKVFYTSSSPKQKSLAESCAAIIEREYQITADILGLPQKELNPCSLVFCDGDSDPYVVKCEWFSFVDGVQCWPVIGESSLPLEKPMNGYLLYHLLPHEIADTTLRERGVDPVSGAWLIEGTGDYVMLECAKELGGLDNTYWLNSVKRDIADLSKQEERIVDLSNRSSFEGFGAPFSADQAIFYVGSLVVVQELVNRYGEGIISEIVAANCKTTDEICDVIKKTTGDDFREELTLSVKEIKDGYTFLLDNVGIKIGTMTMERSRAEKEEKTRGIAVGSDWIGDEASVTEIIDFFDECDINMLVVDFGWITWSWNNTRFDAIDELIEKTQNRGIPIWLMYRARTLPAQYTDLPHQIDKTGKAMDRDICFTHEECRNWSLAWTDKLLGKYPNVDGMILYNPRISPGCCYCDKCIKKFSADTGISQDPREFQPGTLQYDSWLGWRSDQITQFIEEWSDHTLGIKPEIDLGAVVLSPEYGSSDTGQNLRDLSQILDVISPFVALDGESIDKELAEDVCNDTKQNSDGARVIADIKIYGPYKNTDKDIINAMKSALKSRGDGFFIWCFDCLDPEKYDLELIKQAYSQ